MPSFVDAIRLRRRPMPLLRPQVVVWTWVGRQWDGAPGRYLRRFDYGGLLAALVFFCWSLTPSLLPRPLLVQSLESGISLLIGYGVGSAIGWGVRRTVLRRPSARVRVIAWQVLGVVAVVATVVLLWLHARWQHEVRALVQADQPGSASYFRVLGLALLVGIVLLTVCRGVRAAVRYVARHVLRFLPRRIATTLATVIVGVALILLINGVLARLLLGAANVVFRAADNGDKPGVVRTTDPLRSGGPSSLMSWDSLGKEGRAFVSTGPTVADISAFSGTAAKDPIRVYAGLRSADTLRAEAALAVRELERTGAFQRKVLAIATTTGRGWVDPLLADPLEFMYGGDTAIVSMQYSYLPSWLSFLVDQTRAREAGSELFNQVYDRWSQLPADSRPRLLVFGESLGAYGGQAAFSGAADLRNRTDGVLWVGPPYASSLTREFTQSRDGGSPERLPVYQGGRTVRFAADGGALRADGWNAPRVAVVQHASDPIVWWSWDLLLHKPDWLKERRGSDVIQSIRWYPVVTFWQITGDLIFSQGATPGHGHRYDEESTRAWCVVAPPDGWTASDTERLVKLIHQRKIEADQQNG